MADFFKWITWKGFQPWGSSRSRWSTSDWAALHRWACQRPGWTGVTLSSPCKGIIWSVGQWYFDWAGDLSYSLSLTNLKLSYSNMTQGPRSGCHVPLGCQLPNLRASTKLSTLQGFSLEWKRRWECLGSSSSVVKRKLPDIPKRKTISMGWSACPGFTLFFESSLFMGVSVSFTSFPLEVALMR